MHSLDKNLRQDLKDDRTTDDASTPDELADQLVDPIHQSLLILLYLADHHGRRGVDQLLRLELFVVSRHRTVEVLDALVYTANGRQHVALGHLFDPAQNDAQRRFQVFGNAQETALAAHCFDARYFGVNKYVAWFATSARMTSASIANAPACEHST